jgi:hypothetical protein
MWNFFATFARNQIKIKSSVDQAFWDETKSFLQYKAASVGLRYTYRWWPCKKLPETIVSLKWTVFKLCHPAHLFPYTPCMPFPCPPWFHYRLPFKHTICSVCLCTTRILPWNIFCHHYECRLFNTVFYLLGQSFW